jgi:hypothetical protein
MKVLDKYCKQTKCEHYIEWEFGNADFEQPYDCYSCKLQGESYNITAIAETCPNRGKLLKLIIRS